MIADLFQEKRRPQLLAKMQQLADHDAEQLLHTADALWLQILFLITCNNLCLSAYNKTANRNQIRGQLKASIPIAGYGERAIA